MKLGTFVGGKLGIADGLIVGPEEGTTLGRRVGTYVGAGLGLREGILLVGRAVGEIVGSVHIGHKLPSGQYWHPTHWTTVPMYTGQRPKGSGMEDGTLVLGL